MERWLVIPDLHWDAREDLHPSYLLVKKFAKDFEPDGIVFLGDIFDFAYISSFNKELLRTISGKTFRADYDLGNRELDYWQKISKRIIILQGNHDKRVDIVADKSPILEGLIEPEINLHYKERGIEYYRDVEQPIRIGKLYFAHGFYTNINHPKKHLQALAGNIVYGHVHKIASYTMNLLAQGEEIGAWSIGCLTSKAPAWAKGRPMNWQNGFAIVYINDDGTFNLYVVYVINNQFIWDGRLFRL